MIGEFHCLNLTPGLHNKDFFPLRSPVPLLALRAMVESDLLFLAQPGDAPARQAQYLNAYLRNLGEGLSSARRRQALEYLQCAEDLEKSRQEEE
jgi:hypothetical protein